MYLLIIISKIELKAVQACKFLVYNKKWPIHVIDRVKEGKQKMFLKNIFLYNFFLQHFNITCYFLLIYYFFIIMLTYSKFNKKNNIYNVSICYQQNLC